MGRSNPDAEPFDAASAIAAAAILETVPPVMRAIRGQMRSQGRLGLSVPQFRALFFIRRKPGTDLTGIAEHLGTTPAASSELVDRLVRQGLVVRVTDERERRRIQLTLSPSGTAQLERAQALTTEWLTGLVGELGPDRLARLTEALHDLRDALRASELGSDEAADPGGGPSGERPVDGTSTRRPSRDAGSPAVAPAGGGRASPTPRS